MPRKDRRVAFRKVVLGRQAHYKLMRLREHLGGIGAVAEALNVHESTVSRLSGGPDRGVQSDIKGRIHRLYALENLPPSPRFNQKTKVAADGPKPVITIERPLLVDMVEALYNREPTAQVDSSGVTNLDILEAVRSLDAKMDKLIIALGGTE